MLKVLMSKYLLMVYLGILLLLTVLPINAPGGSLNNTYVMEVRLDYLLHFLIYLPIVYLMVQCFRLYLAVILSLVVAVGMEFLQYAVPYRSFNVNDLVANVLACILSLGLWLLIKRLRKAPCC